MNKFVFSTVRQKNEFVRSFVFWKNPRIPKVVSKLCGINYDTWELSIMFHSHNMHMFLKACCGSITDITYFAIRKYLF